MEPEAFSLSFACCRIPLPAAQMLLSLRGGIVILDYFKVKPSICVVVNE